MSVDPMDIINLGLQPGWQDRLRSKLATAAILSSVAAAAQAVAEDRSILRNVLYKTLGYSAGMAAFCGVQESLRSIRGRHDALNSAAGGAAAGALMAGLYQGRQYCLLGAVVWGPICGALHLTDDWLHPGQRLEDALIDNGLLSPLVRDRRTLVTQPSQQVDLVARSPVAEDLSKETVRIRAAELEALRVRMSGSSSSSSAGASVASTSRDMASRGWTDSRRAIPPVGPASTGGPANTAVSIDDDPQRSETSRHPPTTSWWRWLWRRPPVLSGVSNSEGVGSTSASSTGGTSGSSTSGTLGASSGHGQIIGSAEVDAGVDTDEEEADFQLWLRDESSQTADSVWREVEHGKR